MGFKAGAATSQYRSFGAQGSIFIEDKHDWTPRMVAEAILWAQTEGQACFYDDDGDEVIVADFPGRPQEIYTPSAFKRSLTKYMAPIR